jgi:hypothetical protein
VTLLARIGYSLEIVGETPSTGVGDSAVYTFTGRGGLSPYRFSMVTEELGPEWTYQDNGDGTFSVQTDEADTAGTFDFTIRITDANRVPVDQAFAIQVIALPLSLSGTFDAGTVDVTYNDTLTRSGGTPSFTFSVASGTLPAGLSLNSSTGTLSGTPTTAATYVFTIQVEDSLGAIATSGAQSVTIAAAPVFYVDDYVTPAAAWSVEKKLISDYAGALFRVRRSNDDAESDIGFDGDGNRDDAALAAHVGANSGYVTRVYDQMGDANADMLNATAAQQPRIVNAGVIDSGAVFDGSNDNLRASGSFTVGSTSATLFMKIKDGLTGTGVVPCYFDSGFTSGTQSGWALTYRTLTSAPFTPAVATEISDSASNLNINTYPAAGTSWASAEALLSATFVKGTPSSSSLYINGSLATASNWFTANVSAANPAPAPALGFIGQAGTHYSNMTFWSCVVTNDSADISARADVEAVLT